MPDFPDGPLDPPDDEECPKCGCDLEDLEDEERKNHVAGCDPASLKAELEFDEAHDEGRLGYQR